MPLNIVQKSECTITFGAVTTRFSEEYTYDIKTKAVWRGDQEFRLFAYLETGYLIVKESTGSYQGTTGPKEFTESTRETMVRDVSIFDDPTIFDEWKNDLGRVDSRPVLKP